MRTWVRRMRGTLGMGLTWAAGWAVAGLLIGVGSVLLPFLPWSWFLDVFDAPLPALAVPGFVGGVLFSLVLRVAARDRRFDELSIPRFAAWGALGGLLLSLVPAVMVALGLATLEPGGSGMWRNIAVIAGPFMLLGAASAVVSLLLAREGESREPAALDDPAPGRLAGGEAATAARTERDVEPVRREGGG